MFERPRHQVIAVFLQTLDAQLLQANHCLFGGGTAMAMRFGEYRESVDVDFLVADEGGYRQLRQLVRGREGIAALARAPAAATMLAGDVRTDQYGIRARVQVGGVAIKFDIVREARIALDPPAPADEVCGVATLSRVDMAASKLLANSDRGLDDSTFNRDLLDLAMLEPARGELVKALAKSEAAYGDDIRRDLAGSVQRLRDRDGWLEACMEGLAMWLPGAVVWARVRRLARRVERLGVS